MKNPTLNHNIPRLTLVKAPTPLETKALTLGSNIVNFLVKRDDITHSEYGGNKVRKLEFIIAEALARGCKEIITFGAIGTNHGVATALFCKKLNLRCKIILFDQPKSQIVANNLKLMASLGAKIIYKQSILKTAAYFYYLKARAKPYQYFLFAGGSNEAGCFGFINAAFELKQQLAESPLQKPDYIYCPVGSSATLAGLNYGMALTGLHSKVIGVRVAPSHLGPIPTCTTSTIKALTARTRRKLHHYHSNKSDLNKLLSIPPPPLNLLNTYFGKGYGIKNEDNQTASKLFTSIGMKLESTYTEKTAQAFIEHVKREPHKKFLFWYTFNSANTSKLIKHDYVKNVPSKLIGMIDTP